MSPAIPFASITRRLYYILIWILQNNAHLLPALDMIKTFESCIPYHASGLKKC
jgi:hypothetical protein